MKAVFAVAQRMGDGKSSDTAYRPWYMDALGFAGHSAVDIGDWFAGNVFSGDQSVLDAIVADPRTEFSFPIDIDGTTLDYSDIFEIPPAMRGKIIAWCAKTYGKDFGDWVATNAKNRRFVAQEIMRKACGVPDADPLNGFRIRWE